MIVNLTEWERQVLSRYASGNALTYMGHAAMGGLNGAEKETMKLWEELAKKLAEKEVTVTVHVNSGAYRRLSREEWIELGGDDNKQCDWHEGIGYVIYDEIARQEYLNKARQGETAS